MSKSFRVRTEVGKDQNVTFEIKQDFDLLEILSLSLSQQDVYTRMCADFGVLCGRVIVNGGYGVPNAKVSVFVPLDEKDEDNPMVTELYPFQHITDKDEDGVRYNLLSREKNFECHVPVGTFPLLGDVLTRQEVQYVYKKYYKYTVKTNESGDFMIYGAPVGTHDILMDVDVSDIGCFSLLPQDFKEQGFADTDFDGARFKRNTSIDSLPQVMSQTKSVDIRPFWGDEEFCRAAITRVDFDLSDNGFKIQPTAILMGSTATDTDKDSVNKSCRPKKHQGDLCSLVTEPGLIDCIRYTPFFKYDENAYGFGTIPLGGTVPILERYYFENNGRVIDSSGSFLVHVPMNLDHMTTNEFGELVKSGNPDVGVPTRARCRFRVRPEQSAGTARLRRKANYLVPNIREYDHGAPNNWIDRRSYTFSINYSDYHPHAQTYLIPAAKDYFYDMTFNRVYSPAQFHDHIKHNGRRQFIGIKEILPEEDQQCSTTAVHFPINSAVRKVTFMLILAQFINEFLGMIYAMLITFVSLLAFIFGIVLGIVFAIIGVICAFLQALCNLLNSFPTILGITIVSCPSWLQDFICSLGCGDFCFGSSCFGCQGPNDNCLYFGIPMGFVLFTLRQTKYPECEKCKCRGTMGELQFLVSSCNGANPGNPPGGSGPCPSAGPIYSFGAQMGTWGNDDCCPGGDDTLVCCPDNYGFDSASTAGSTNDFAAFGGCYVKTVCFNVACLSENFNMRLLQEWVRRQNIADSLCAGVMNYFWENAWVTGFLYMFQFKAKLRFDTVNQNYNGSDYCKRVAYVHPNDHVFYYRSTPFTPDPTTGLGTFDGDPSGVALPWWGLFGGSPDHADGDQNDHILFPTTITDMGSRNQCIQDICLDPRYAEECSVTDQIGSTSFQDITELVSDIYNLKANNTAFVLGSFFNRPEKEIGGDVAQAIMQNCMVGIYGYETNMSNVDCDCSAAPPVVNNQPGLIEYPPAVDQNMNNTNVVPNIPPGQYVQYAVNANPAYTIEWEPHLFTASTSTIMSGIDLQYCVGFSLSASTQELPFYPWRINGTPWGNEYNDWQGTLGTYMQPTGAISNPAVPFTLVNQNTSGAPFPNWANSSGLFQGGPNGPMGAPPLQVGTVGGPTSFQVTWGPDPTNSFPPMSLQNSPTFQMSGPLFYYFGLRPGETSYHTFIRMYVDEELADSVL